jgi:hypothetical protein
MTIEAKSIRRIKGGVTIRDYRGTGLCPPNGGKIRPLVYVHHIPVIHDAPGWSDLITLGNVLRTMTPDRLAVANGTDAEGNIALFTDMDELCYHARGSNGLSCGTEHMHYSIAEPWSEKHYRAAAYLAWQAHEHHGIPLQGARLLSGNPTPVARRGHTSHQVQSVAAGYHDRSDPGTLFRYHHMYELAHFYGKHRRF